MSDNKKVNLEVLKPTAEYLTHPMVLAQAWKKSHQYIRRTSWLADMFELDRSAILLDQNLEQWASELKSGNVDFQPLKLVPAPKTSTWSFHSISEGDVYFNENYSYTDDFHAHNKSYWGPDKREGANKLRPLAHIDIREQSYMTALMMCCANRVETLQGATNTSFDEVHEKGVVNYGNRLFCHFDMDTGDANFSWGSSNTYSRYYQDYKRFLGRPKHFAKSAVYTRMPGEEVFEVHLDIKQFYDSVDRGGLTQKILRLFDYHDPIMKKLLAGFNEWQWEAGTAELYNSACKDDDSKPLLKGIPQGLVSAGFWANIYLLGFDDELASLIGSEVDGDVQVIDYCRYVDDLRLVVISRNSKEAVEEFIDNCIAERLEKLGLALNEEKTNIESYKRPIKNISTKLKAIQEKASGPMSMNELDEQLGHLEGLIGLAENIGRNKEEKLGNPLADIEAVGLDVREDTLLRFTANKIHSLLTSKRNLLSQDVDEDDNPIAGDWDYLQERMARKFIACWSRDPSLVLMLKKALEMFPDPKILEPVLSQLKLVLGRECQKEAMLAKYCVSEVFRHAATVINAKTKWAFPAHSKLDSFYAMLIKFADEVMENALFQSDYLLAQVRLLLLVRGKLPKGLCHDEGLHKLIYQLKFGVRNIEADYSVDDVLVGSVLAYQMANTKETVIEALDSLLKKVPSVSFIDGDGLNQTTVPKFLKRIALASTDLFEALLSYGIENDRKWVEHCRALIRMSGIEVPFMPGDLTRFNATSKKEIGLLSVIKRADNPFADENAILLLVNTILNDTGILSRDIDVTQVRIGCSDWSGLNSFQTELRLSVEGDPANLFVGFGEDTLSEQELELYRVGMLIRTCLIGKVDWTSVAHLPAKEPGYRGVVSSFHKRRVGMMHSPESLLGCNASISSWLSSLLSHLLKWPGVKPVNDLYTWPKEMDLSVLKRLVEKRIKEQKKNYCSLSDTPGYVERVKLDWPEDKKDLNVVMVQSLLPSTDDFDTKTCLLPSTSAYRATHRRHIASVAELIVHKVASQNSVYNEEERRKAKIDLIVWPELAVDHSDIDILKRLSDKTGAMIYTGLNFISQPNVPGPNNCALWIVPKHTNNGRHFLYRFQGKYNMTRMERGKIEPWRPYQLFIELVHPAFSNSDGFKLTGSICYDATDIKLSADLKGKSHAYLVSALNKDVATFDSMIDALYYHMYQYVVLVNTGEFGGSVAKAPYKERHDKLITHVHGANQVSISSFQMNMFDFRGFGKGYRSGKAPKTKPAGEI